MKYLSLAVAFILLLASASFAENSRDIYKVVILETMPVNMVLQNQESLIEHLKHKGYVSGENITIEILKADGDYDKAVKLLTDTLKKGKPDIVVSNATLAAKAAKKTLPTDIPIVFITVTDPVGAGLIDEVGEPSGSNVTGVVYTIPRKVKVDFALELATQKVKDRPVKIGWIYTTYPSSVGGLNNFIEVAREYGNIEFVPRKIEYKPFPRYKDEIFSSVLKELNDLEGKVDFLWEPTGPLGESPEYTKLLLDNSDIPILMGNTLKSTELGSLMNISSSPEATGKAAAEIIHKILSGENPGDIAANPPKVFDLGINLKSAIDNGIIIPSNLVRLAGENIYR